MNYISESKFCGILKYFDFLIAFSCQLDTKFSQSSKLIPDVFSKIVTLTIQISNHIIFHPLENDLKVIFNFFLVTNILFFHLRLRFDHFSNNNIFVCVCVDKYECDDKFIRVENWPQRCFTKDFLFLFVFLMENYHRKFRYFFFKNIR